MVFEILDPSERADKREFFPWPHTGKRLSDNDTFPEKYGLLENLTFDDSCDLHLDLNKKRAV